MSEIDKAALLGLIIGFVVGWSVQFRLKRILEKKGSADNSDEL